VPDGAIAVALQVTLLDAVGVTEEPDRAQVIPAGKGRALESTRLTGSVVPFLRVAVIVFDPAVPPGIIEIGPEFVRS